MARPLLVGECAGRHYVPGLPLHTYPPGAAGDRLSRILRMDHVEYLRTFDRVNLCDRTWDSARAYCRAMALMDGRHRKFVLLGRRVAKAFGVNTNLVLTVVQLHPGPRSAEALLLPHPSGRCRYWNDEMDRARARVALNEFIGRKM
jgi:hypothetical protein